MQRSCLKLAFLSLLLAACASAAPEATATVPPSPQASRTPRPSATPQLPGPSATPSATPKPVPGTTKAQVYVRSGPGTTYASLGLIDPGKQVQIVAQEADGKWFIILYPGGPGGHGWVTAAFVQAGSPADIPTVTPNISPTPSGPTGLVMQKLNVRSGPGTGYDSLGILPAQSAVVLTGKNDTASWLQIEYASAPGGHGWVNAAYVQIKEPSDLPVLDAYGNPAADSTQTGTPGAFSTLTPTVGPAPDNGDSAQQPAVRLAFSPSGAHQFTYSGQVSAPQGNADDWLEFIPYAASGTSASLTVSLACSSSSGLEVELLQGGAPLSGWGTLQCGDVNRAITLTAGEAYMFQLSAVSREGQTLVAYTLKVRNGP